MKKHFSVEEIEEIRRAMAEQGVKDTDFTTTSELNDEDKFAIVQGEENKLIDTSVLSGKVFADHKEYIDSAVEVVSDKLDTEIIDRATKDSELETKITNLENIPIWNGGNNSLIGNTKTNVVGFTSSAFGSNTRASGMCSFAEGINTVASGNNSHAEGSATKATNTNAHSEGDATIASMRGAHSEGVSTQSNGIASHSEGESTIANKRAAHSEGYGTQSGGAYSHSEGYYTITSAQGGHSQGTYNEDDSNAIHIIGIGTSDTDRKNSEVVYNDGTKYLYGIGNYNGTKSSIVNGARDLATVISDIQTGLSDEEIARKEAVNAEAEARQTSDSEINADLDKVKSLIPNTATSENQLADKEFVNSSITTNTATFKGTFETADDLPATDVKANDYAFVIATDSTGNPEYQRYKYSNNAWAFEYTLNNSSFTAEQWAAITSGITSTKITSLEDADKSLTDKINAEATTREAEDTALNEAVTALQAIPIAKGAGEESILVNSVDSNLSSGKYSFSAGEHSNAGGECSAAIGSYCGAYGKFSFCAGQGCVTLGDYGIALGNHTTSGYSIGAVALCNYNEDDTGLIHSVGIGKGDSARKNAEAIYTDGKKYVYGVGNYDGTKASIEKGALDIATVINNIQSSVTDEVTRATAADTTLEAKIPTTTEDFVFTLEDGTEVTKSIYVK